MLCTCFDMQIDRMGGPKPMAKHVCVHVSQWAYEPKWLKIAYVIFTLRHVHRHFVWPYLRMIPVRFSMPLLDKRRIPIRVNVYLYTYLYCVCFSFYLHFGTWVNTEHSLILILQYVLTSVVNGVYSPKHSKLKTNYMNILCINKSTFVVAVIIIHSLFI